MVVEYVDIVKVNLVMRVDLNRNINKYDKIK